jgi:FkbM family methyltransferase
LFIYFRYIIKPLKLLFAIFGLSIHKTKSISLLFNKSYSSNNLNIDFLKNLPVMESDRLLVYMQTSKSQLGQDFFALMINEFKNSGNFIEIGATNGITLSNTYLLEKEFNWTGLLVEPAKIWHKDLFKNRTSKISKKCVFNSSGKLVDFNETKYRSLSTIDQFSFNDQWRDLRTEGKKYVVETITLNDLIFEHDLPDFIDYLSIDTEGSEFEILSKVDFQRYKFAVITCEHNFTLNRDKIFNLLSKNGYLRVYEKYSQSDDWYVHESIKSTI